MAGPLYGRSLLLTGASGGVGHFFVELAAAQGARVTAVTASPARGQRLLELGAHAIVTHVQLGRGPFEVVLDSVGGATTQAAWRTLTPDGTFVWFGQASRTPSTLDFFDWAGGLNATLRKFHYLEPLDGIQQDLSTLVDLTAAGRLTPEIGFLDDWALTENAIEHLLARRLRGHARARAHQPDLIETTREETQMTTNDKALAVRWPMPNAPEFASIRVSNSTPDDRKPGNYLGLADPPQAVASLLRQRQAHPPPRRPHGQRLGLGSRFLSGSPSGLS